MLIINVIQVASIEPFKSDSMPVCVALSYISITKPPTLSEVNSHGEGNTSTI